MDDRALLDGQVLWGLLKQKDSEYVTEVLWPPGQRYINPKMLNMQLGEAMPKTPDLCHPSWRREIKTPSSVHSYPLREDKKNKKWRNVICKQFICMTKSQVGLNENFLFMPGNFRNLRSWQDTLPSSFVNREKGWFQSPALLQWVLKWQKSEIPA